MGYEQPVANRRRNWIGFWLSQNDSCTLLLSIICQTCWQLTVLAGVLREVGHQKNHFVGCSPITSN